MNTADRTRDYGTLRLASSVCLLAAMTYLIPVYYILDGSGPDVHGARPTGLVFGVVGLAIYLIPAFGFIYARWRLTTGRLDVIVLAIVLAAAGLVSRITAGGDTTALRTLIPIRAVADVAIIMLLGLWLYRGRSAR